MATYLPRPDQFEERRFLGGGGAGQVYLVWDRQRSEQVALKVVRTTDRDLLVAEENGARLQQELSRVAPQVPRVYDFGENQGAFFVVMEYVEGEDLSQVILHHALGEERAIRIAIQLCEFLNRLHTYSTEIGGRKVLGVVHGDIKPDNIRLIKDDRIRVLDFGIARQLSLSRPVTRSLFGSLPYIPPERLERGDLDSRSDLWAASVVLYALISGHLPFAGSTQEEVAARLRRGELRPLPESCSRPLRWVVYKGLSSDPERRYPTAAALQADLEAVRDGRLEADELPEKEPVTTRPERGPGLRQGLLAPRQEGAKRSRPTGRIIRNKPPQETRRTVPKDSPRRPNRKRWPMAVLVVALPILLLGSYQLYLRGEAEKFRRDLLTGALPNLDLAWQRYAPIRRWALFGLEDFDREMALELRKAADRIFASYSGDDPRTTPEEWERAREYLSKAIYLGSSGPETQARLIYSRGQLALSEARSFRKKGDLEGARRKQEDAAARFQDAADLDPAWPDPYLGLARIHVYEHFDYEKLQRALADAERRGYAERRRITAFRADGRLNEGRRLYSESMKARGRDGEEGLLEQALSHFNEALRLYGEIPGYANVGRVQVETARRKRLVENRLNALAASYDEEHEQSNQEDLDPALVEDGWP